MKKFLMIMLASFTMAAVAEEAKQTEQELKTTAAEKLAALDADKDGLVSVAEAAKDEMLTGLFAELDKNKDGYLSEAELSS